MKELLYGAAYYDEYMPYDRLDKDVAMMKKAGINTVRIAESTWSTCVFQTKSGQWIYFGDRWNSTDLADSRYIWLPLAFNGNKVEIQWESEFILQ